MKDGQLFDYISDHQLLKKNLHHEEDGRNVGEIALDPIGHEHETFYTENKGF